MFLDYGHNRPHVALQTARAGFHHKACCSDVRHFRVMHRLCDTEDAEVAQAVAVGVEWS